MCDAKGDIMYIRRPFFSLFRFYSVSSTTINLHLITYLDSDTVYHSPALSFLSQPRCHYRREVDHDRYYLIQLVIRQSPLLFESNHLHLVSFHPSSPHSFLVFVAASVFAAAFAKFATLVVFGFIAKLMHLTPVDIPRAPYSRCPTPIMSSA